MDYTRPSPDRRRIDEMFSEMKRSKSNRIISKSPRRKIDYDVLDFRPQRDIRPVNITDRFKSPTRDLNRSRLNFSHSMKSPTRSPTRRLDLQPMKSPTRSEFGFHSMKSPKRFGFHSMKSPTRSPTRRLDLHSMKSPTRSPIRRLVDLQPMKSPIRSGFGFGLQSMKSPRRFDLQYEKYIR
jgi:hypothetical protein